MYAPRKARESMSVMTVLCRILAEMSASTQAKRQVKLKIRKGSSRQTSTKHTTPAAVTGSCMHQTTPAGMNTTSSKA